MTIKNGASEEAVEIFVRQEPLSLSSDLEKWLLSIKSKIGTRILQNLNANTDNLDRYIEFAEISEVPGAFIACAFYQRDINDALTRAGIFMGAGIGMKAKTLVRHSEFPLLNYKKLVAGHNLPGSVLQNFYSALAQSKDEASKANEAEAAVAEEFLKHPKVAELKNEFYLIGFSIQTMKDQMGVISHEVFHALSFLNPRYREVIASFWRDVVSTEDQRLITEEIGRAYNVEDEELVIDEFQAYLVQARAETDRMKAFVPKYRHQLLERIRQANITLPRVPD